MAELDDGTHEQIKALCAQGDQHAEAGDYTLALKHYRQAWGLLPKPKARWTAATWILGAVGDVSFLSGDFKAGRDALSNAMHCPDAIGNPFLHLRLGQCQFELGNFAKAADELTRAMMSEGEEYLQDEDPKYWEFLKTKLKAPPGGWSGEATPATAATPSTPATPSMPATPTTPAPASGYAASAKKPWWKLW